MSPLVALVARARGSRMFHPEGIVRRATVVATATDESLRPVAERLAGPAFVRFSSAWWKDDKEWIDALGCAVRFTRRVVGPEPAEGDQDLLFATIRHPWTTPFAPMTTNVHSFLDGYYFGVSPFSCDDVGIVKFRIRTPGIAGGVVPRRESLEVAVDEGRAILHLEVKRLRRDRQWLPLAGIEVGEELFMDQSALRFSPFRAGRGIRPRGIVHALRRATYLGSQLARARP